MGLNVDYWHWLGASERFRRFFQKTGKYINVFRFFPLRVKRRLRCNLCASDEESCKVPNEASWTYLYLEIPGRFYPLLPLTVPISAWSFLSNFRVSCPKLRIVAKSWQQRLWRTWLLQAATKLMAQSPWIAVWRMRNLIPCPHYQDCSKNMKCCTHMSLVLIVLEQPVACQLI